MDISLSLSLHIYRDRYKYVSINIQTGMCIYLYIYLYLCIVMSYINSAYTHIRIYEPLHISLPLALSATLVLFFLCL